MAETLSVGLSGIPHSALIAMAIAGVLGIVLALVERRVSGHRLLLVPSGATVGLAFVIPAGTSITLFLGAALGEPAALARAALGRALPVERGRRAGGGRKPVRCRLGVVLKRYSAASAT